MKCERARGRLSAWLDGELTPAAAEALEEHLAACPGCAAERERLAAVRDAFRSLTPAAPPADLAGAVLERIREETGADAGPASRTAAPSHRRWPRWATPARTAAALALAAAGLGALWLALAPGETPAGPVVAEAAGSPSPLADAAYFDLATEVECNAAGDCTQPAPCDDPADCGGGPPCSEPGECGGDWSYR